MLYERADEDAGNNGGADPDDSKGEADVALVPGVAIFRVEDIDGLECLVSEIVQSRNDGQAREFHDPFAGTTAEGRFRLSSGLLGLTIAVPLGSKETFGWLKLPDVRPYFIEEDNKSRKELLPGLMPMANATSIGGRGLPPFLSSIAWGTVSTASTVCFGKSEDGRRTGCSTMDFDFVYMKDSSLR